MLARSGILESYDWVIIIGYLESCCYNINVGGERVGREVDRDGYGYSEATLVINKLRDEPVKHAFERMRLRERYANSIRGTDAYKDYESYCDGLRRGTNKWYNKHWKTEDVELISMVYMEDVKVKKKKINHYLECGCIDYEEVDPEANLYIDNRQLWRSYLQIDLLQTLYINDRLTAYDIDLMSELTLGLTTWLKCCGLTDYEASETIRGRFTLDKDTAIYYSCVGYVWYGKTGRAYIAKLPGTGAGRKKGDFALVVELIRDNGRMLRIVPVTTLSTEQVHERIKRFKDTVIYQ